MVVDITLLLWSRYGMARYGQIWCKFDRTDVPCHSVPGTSSQEVYLREFGENTKNQEKIREFDGKEWYGNVVYRYMQEDQVKLIMVASDLCCKRKVHQVWTWSRSVV